jgi:hypothetical protein
MYKLLLAVALTVAAGISRAEPDLAAPEAAARVAAGKSL